MGYWLLISMYAHGPSQLCKLHVQTNQIKLPQNGRSRCSVMCYHLSKKVWQISEEVKQDRMRYVANLAMVNSQWLLHELVNNSS